jgi:hypothetical protein
LGGRVANSAKTASPFKRQQDIQASRIRIGPYYRAINLKQLGKTGRTATGFPGAGLKGLGLVLLEKAS